MSDKLINLKVNATKKQEELLNSLGLDNVASFLSKYPSRYVFLEETDLVDNAKCVVDAKIISVPKIVFYRGKQNRITFDVLVKDQNISVIIFNRSFILKHLKATSDITILGTYYKDKNQIVASDIKFSKVSDIAGVYPVYRLNNTYKNSDYHKLVLKVLKENINNIDNILPDYLISKYRMLQRKDSLIKIHYPKNETDVKLANRSLIYEELFLFSIKSYLVKLNALKNKKIIKEIDFDLVNDFISTLPFSLTKDQQTTIEEIFKDFSSEKIMNRLLLADVGSGKTIVAFISSYMMFLSGYQTAFMAPTTILATQHYYEALKVFKNSELKVELLTSKTSPKEREALLNDLKKGKIDLLIGTHALIQDDVDFKQLGYLILDEQQRFGVNQRLALKKQNPSLETLMLSATPIPRTLAQAYFSSIDTSIIKTIPKFKKEIKSYYFKSNSIKPFYQEMLQLLKMRTQIYIVTPLVEESESLDVKNVSDIHEKISNHFKDQYNVSMIHGKMKDDEKNDIMQQFHDHQIDILVCTSIIEVGISVDNANCIIIYDAHRFGLSQLHQLRGRVGRSIKQGHCVFLSNSDDENAINRLEFIANNQDGFEISEYDLKTRGPGDVLGLRQSGIPEFNIANIARDFKIYEIAFSDALEFIKSNDFKPWYALYHDYVINKTNQIG